MYRKLYKIIFFVTISFSQIPNNRVIAEWEPAIGTMIRWPLGIPIDLVVELASDDIVYVLVETNNQQNQAQNNFDNWGVNLLNVVFINTDTYSHWTRDHGPQFLIGDVGFKVINQQFNGYPVESGCDEIENECIDEMIMNDCIGISFCNNQPEYASEGYDCYVNNELCEDFNGDGQVMDWLGDGYCDDGTWGLDFMCNEFSFDCGDCGEQYSDENNYCEEISFLNYRIINEGRPLPDKRRGWDEDDDTNIDFANQLNLEIRHLPLYWTGGNFMTDGYGMGFSTQLMVNENYVSNDEFISSIDQYLDINNYHIIQNPNVESIQHIDCLAKLVDSETIIIKQVSESSPEYECIEEFANYFYDLQTFYGRHFDIHRILCPEIIGGPWEINPVAAYTNSLILNNKVLVPQYGVIQDEAALNVYRNAMPGYEVIGFDGTANNPWYAEDALHCRTIGIFDKNMIHISHKSIRTEELIDNRIINIDVDVRDYSNSDIDKVVVYWKYSAEDGPFSNFDMIQDNNFKFSANFSNLNSSSSIDYYITAYNIIGDSLSHPIAGWHQFITSNIEVGDLNYDGQVNISDIILLVNLIIDNSAYSQSADLNFDGFIDVVDVIQLINLILS